MNYFSCGKASYEPCHEKTNIPHMRKLRRRSALQLLISTFVFASRIVQFLSFLNPKVPVSSHLFLSSSVPVQLGLFQTCSLLVFS